MRAEGLALQFEHAFPEDDNPLRAVHGYPSANVERRFGIL
jgi:hypothetical protein